MRAFIAGLLVLLAAPAAALGHGTPVAPAGNSAVNQYVEILPTASGGRPSSSVETGNSGGSESSPITASTQRALARQGGVGAQAAAVAEATAPHLTARPVVHRKRGAHPLPGITPGGGSVSVYNGPAAPHRSSASQLAAALTGSATHGGLGALMPILLVAAAAGAVALALRRRRQ